MAYVPVPKDLSKIKTKLAFNLTKRQLVCFSSAAAVGLPAYLFSRGSIGNSAAMFLMIGLMLPFFFLAMYAVYQFPYQRTHSGRRCRCFFRNEPGVSVSEISAGAGNGDRRLYCAMSHTGSKVFASIHGKIPWRDQQLSLLFQPKSFSDAIQKERWADAGAVP